ncbi:MAG: hypothetical protein JSS22_14190 [Proteobacteria bacterium]|nr:hypothetical protein [Pseudomonadota bacterium]
MLHKTGPGKIKVFMSQRWAGVLTALLYNFDFDDYYGETLRDLKREHQIYLKDHVEPLLANNSGNIWMRGSASQIGTSPWNQRTSEARVYNVAKFLQGLGVADGQMRLDAIGSDATVLHRPDEETDRGVTLWVQPRPIPEPPPREVPRKALITKHFKIALVTGLSLSQAVNVGKVFRGVKLGGGVAIDGLIFLILDTENNIACLYVYIGIGLGSGFNFTPKVSATTLGPWTSFETEKEMSCWQFGRWARFTTAGAASHSVNWITMETPPGIDNVSSLSIDTGTTLGMGASTTIGDIIRVGQPYRYSGP